MDLGLRKAECSYKTWADVSAQPAPTSSKVLACPEIFLCTIHQIDTQHVCSRLCREGCKVRGLWISEAPEVPVSEHKRRVDCLYLNSLDSYYPSLHLCKHTYSQPTIYMGSVTTDSNSSRLKYWWKKWFSAEHVYIYCLSLFYEWQLFSYYLQCVRNYMSSRYDFKFMGHYNMSMILHNFGIHGVLEPTIPVVPTLTETENSSTYLTGFGYKLNVHKDTKYLAQCMSQKTLWKNWREGSAVKILTALQRILVLFLLQVSCSQRP